MFTFPMPRACMPMPFIIVIPVYQGVTQLDFTGPHQFFSQLPDTLVIVASVAGRSVEANGLEFSSLADLTTIDQCDLLCVPGGGGCVAAIEDLCYMTAIRRLAAGARYVTSVCTGSLILGAAGLLVGKRAACHWAWRDMLPLFGAIPDDGRVVRDGNIITGGGVTAGIDFALVVINELFGELVAQSIQLGLEYAPQPPFNAGRPESASPLVHDTVMAKNRESAAVRREMLVKAAQSLRVA